MHYNVLHHPGTSMAWPDHQDRIEYSVFCRSSLNLNTLLSSPFRHLLLSSQRKIDCGKFRCSCRADYSNSNSCTDHSSKANRRKPSRLYLFFQTLSHTLECFLQSPDSKPAERRDFYAEIVRICGNHHSSIVTRISLPIFILLSTGNTVHAGMIALNIAGIHPSRI